MIADRLAATKYETLRFLGRATVVWSLIIAAEVIHGIARRLVLEPVTGDFRARQISVFTGAAIVFGIAVCCARWLRSSRIADYLAAGSAWVLLTVVFEVGIGRLLGLSWERILSDYDMVQGGLMPIGLLLMFLSPIAAAKLTGEI